MDRQRPLSSIDGNIQTRQTDALNPLSEKNDKPVPTFAEESKQHHKLHSKIIEQEINGKQGAYVSPSDAILSPTSAKLNALKEKRFTKSVKPRVLFSKPTPAASDTLEKSEMEQAAMTSTCTGAHDASDKA